MTVDPVPVLDHCNEVHLVGRLSADPVSVTLPSGDSSRDRATRSRSRRDRRPDAESAARSTPWPVRHGDRPCGALSCVGGRATSSRSRGRCDEVLAGRGGSAEPLRSRAHRCPAAGPGAVRRGSVSSRMSNPVRGLGPNDVDFLRHALTVRRYGEDVARDVTGFSSRATPSRAARAVHRTRDVVVVGDRSSVSATFQQPGEHQLARDGRVETSPGPASARVAGLRPRVRGRARRSSTLCRPSARRRPYQRGRRRTEQLSGSAPADTAVTTRNAAAALPTASARAVAHTDRWMLPIRNGCLLASTSMHRPRAVAAPFEARSVAPTPSRRRSCPASSARYAA